MTASVVIYWFRNDLRIADNRALVQACAAGAKLLPVYCHDPADDVLTRWDFVRVGPHRRHFLDATLADLAAQLTAFGSGLIELNGCPRDVLPALATQLGATTVFCEQIAAPEEEAEVAALRSAGLKVDTVWQSSLLDPTDLPFAVDALPVIFTNCRQAIEKAGVAPRSPLPVPATIPPLPALPPDLSNRWQTPCRTAASADTRSSFPYHLQSFAGGESAAIAHLNRYFGGGFAHTYKLTRNGLAGTDYSSKFSPWLASGAMSARSAFAALQEFEQEKGANDSTYWLWFELLWRDYFRFLHLQHGRRLYRPEGLGDGAAPSHDPQAFVRWRQGKTGEPFVDAGMRELAATGYLSNRLRQVVASYLVHDLACDWRAGAAWFEAQLIDYDVYSNQGNWLYVSGRGTDPRNGRRFNPDKQARDYDADGQYRQLWRQR